METQAGWPDTCPRFVAFLDIMGFKEMIFRRSHTEVVQMMRRFSDPIELIKEEAEKRAKTNTTISEELSLFGNSTIRPVLFSDSVLIVSNDDSLASAEYILAGVNAVVTNALLEGIAIKGAIAHGEQTADLEKSLYIGRPLIDAYELQKELELYGVIIHHTMERHLINNGLIERLQGVQILNYPAPLKQGIVNHYLVDWSWSPDIDRNWKGILSNLYGNVSGFTRRYVDNTAAFFDWLRKANFEAAKQRPRLSGTPITYKDMEREKRN